MVMLMKNCNRMAIDDTTMIHKDNSLGTALLFEDDDRVNAMVELNVSDNP